MGFISKMIPIYVVHHPKLTERKKYLDSLGLNLRYVSNNESIAKYNPSPEIWKEKTNDYGNFEYRELNMADISCISNHIGIYKQIRNTSEIPFSLVLEDDVIYERQNIKNDILNIYYDIPDDCDVLFLGGSFPHERLKTLKIENGNYHLKLPPNTNCSFSYMVSNRVAYLLATNMQEFTLPIDFELNYWFKKLNLNIYHYIPYILREGSACGKYTSSVKK
jgi:GR25 family glycosyltransferase involved in LPS biosynthesis